MTTARLILGFLLGLVGIAILGRAIEPYPEAVRGATLGVGCVVVGFVLLGVGVGRLGVRR